jgi:eukaryotic-like serine/threonine-protein kinase
MPFAKGFRLGPYEIVDKLGAGGMGEVYRARDARLGRDVAIKVLPPSFARDAERLRRFEQEARAAGALNHPNILAIYDIGTLEGAPFLVTELLQGETLRDRLRGGALPLRKGLEVAIQAAYGVAAAHDRKIIHRDLKPANLFLTNDGRVKILDFGLAKLVEREVSSVGETGSPTRSADPPRETEAGVVLGTVSYMSPEQVRGNPTDARSDIFSLGIILYEMFSGGRAFEKDSSADTMAAILTEEPPGLSDEGKKIPPAIDRVVRHCLEKNPAERFQSARDLAFDLESLSGLSTANTEALAPAAVVKTRRKSRLLFAAMGTAGLIVVALAAYLLGHSAAVSVQPTYHQLTFDRGLVYSARFAPDGQSIYYSASRRAQPIQLYSTSPSSPESRPLNLVDSSLFAVSSSELAISTGCKDLLIGSCEGTLAVVPPSGGAPRDVVDHVVSADWTADGSEMAVIHESQGKFRVEFPLGKVIYESEIWLNFLRISPRGDAVAFVQYATGGADAGWAVILDRNGKLIARSPRQFASVEGLAWPPQGAEVWFGATSTHAWANAIHALTFSARDRIILRLPGMLRLHDISRDGRLLLSKEVWRTGMHFRGPGETGETDVSWLDATVLSGLSSDGRKVTFEEYGEAAGATPLAYFRKTDGSPAVKLGPGFLPTFSPDGQSVLLTIFAPPHLVVLPTGAGEARHLANPGMLQFVDLGWIPGGKRIYFAGNDGHDWRMYVEDLDDGSSRAITPPIFVNPQQHESDLVSPEGNYCFGRDTNGRGWLYPVAGGAPRPVPGLSPEDTWLNWLPDGRSAYVYQDQKTRAQVFRLDLSTGKRQLISNLQPTDLVGLVGILPVRITPDAKWYAYSFNRALSDLYLADGVK